MRQDAAADAVIIGAGIMGCSIALALGRRGLHVAVIDRLPAAGYGSTSFSSAIIRPYYSTWEGCALAWENHFHWQNWRAFVEAEETAEVARYIECGCLVLRNASDRFSTRTLDLMQQLGVPCELLGTDALRAEHPGIDVASFQPVRRIDDPLFGNRAEDPLIGALKVPGGYINDPQLAARNLQAAAEAHGARFRFRAEVTAIRRAGGAVEGVTLADGSRVDSPVVINAGGPFSTAVNRLAGEDVLAGMQVTMRALRNEVAYLDAPPGLSGGAARVISDGDSGVYMRPEAGDRLVVGSQEPPCDALEWVEPDALDGNFTDQWTNQVWRAALRFPDLRIPNTAAGIVALYDVSSDWIPIYDRSDLPGYFMAVGTSGNQLKNAPMVGELMASLVEYVTAGGDHDAQPLVFTLPRLGLPLNLGFFSRRRTPSAESSNTVCG